MADVAIALRTYLLSKSVVADVVGQRIYCDAMPQNATLPAIEMTVVSDVPDMQLSDLSGLTKARVELACVGDRRTTVRSLAQAIRTCGICLLRGLNSGVWIRGVSVQETFDSVILPSDGSDERRYESAVHLEVAYLEQ